MKVNLEQTPENIETSAGEDVLPPETEISPAGPTAEEANRQLEIELAEARGKLSVLQTSTKPVEADQFEAISRNVWSDINTLNETDFQMKHNMEKSKASTLLLQEDSKRTKASHQKEIAELRADNTLTTKYGADYLSVRDEVNAALADASPEVRQDPAKLARFMERAYLAASKESVASTGAGALPRTATGQRRITNFERPAPPSHAVAAPAKEEIAAEYRTIAKGFGISSEAERKQLMQSDVLEMDMGGGYIYSPTSGGFEKKGQ